MGAKTLFSVADYLALDEPDGAQYELSEGELIVSPSTTFSHNEIRDRLNAHLRAFVEPRRMGEVTSETDLQLSSATVRRPDVAFLAAARFRREYRQQVPIPLAPDVVFEVVSDNDRAAALLQKVQQYLAAGSAAVWLLYPKLGLAHRHGGGGVGAATVLQEPELLPGWALELAAIFSPEG